MTLTLAIRTFSDSTIPRAKRFLDIARLRDRSWLAKWSPHGLFCGQLRTVLKHLLFSDKLLGLCFYEDTAQSAFTRKHRARDTIIARSTRACFVQGKYDSSDSKSTRDRARSELLNYWETSQANHSIRCDTEMINGNVHTRVWYLGVLDETEKKWQSAANCHRQALLTPADNDLPIFPLAKAAVRVSVYVCVWAYYKTPLLLISVYGYYRIKRIKRIKRFSVAALVSISSITWNCFFFGQIAETRSADKLIYHCPEVCAFCAIIFFADSRKKKETVQSQRVNSRLCWRPGERAEQKEADKRKFQQRSGVFRSLRGPQSHLGNVRETSVRTHVGSVSPIINRWLRVGYLSVFISERRGRGARDINKYISAWRSRDDCCNSLLLDLKSKSDPNVGFAECVMCQARKAHKRRRAKELREWAQPSKWREERKDRRSPWTQVLSLLGNIPDKRYLYRHHGAHLDQWKSMLRMAEVRKRVMDIHSCRQDFNAYVIDHRDAAHLVSNVSQKNVRWIEATYWKDLRGISDLKVARLSNCIFLPW